MVQMRSVWIWVLIFMNMWERLECVRIIGNRYVNTIHFWVCIVAVSWQPTGSRQPPRRGPYLLTVDMLGGCLFSI